MLLAVTVSVLVRWKFDPPMWVHGVTVGALCGFGAISIVNRAVSPGTSEPSTGQTSHQRTE